jgi:hypothetical protein
MAIVKNPISKTSEKTEQQAAAFIAKAGKPEQGASGLNRKPTMIRIPPELLLRIDQGAKRLGISRSAFIVQSAAEKLEHMDA